LDHANIIRCLRCWQDQDQHCVNLLTEYFTSGNLRDYRQKHKHLELKAVKKWSRQILQGLNYLHSKAPPIIHGDLRCDKIYINGHSGDVKIGDLGLATLLPRRFKPEALPNGINTENQYTQDVDIFAFGLCVLELATCKRLDSSNCQIWPTLVETIPDEECRAFIKRCLGSETRPTAAELLDDPFLTRRLIKNDSQKKVNSMSRESMTALSDTGRSVGRSLSGNSLGASVHASLRSGDLRSADFRSGDFRSNFGSEVDELDSTITCAAGTVRGEDYNFQFSGKIKEGKLSFRLNMQYEGEGEEGTGHRRTIDFAYDPDVDTPEEIATEIGNEFNLSSTDRDICAAALKEWLAKELPDSAS
jgi:WNK lysine deficient protein kinase